MAAFFSRENIGRLNEAWENYEAETRRWRALGEAVPQLPTTEAERGSQQQALWALAEAREAQEEEWSPASGGRGAEADGPRDEPPQPLVYQVPHPRRRWTARLPAAEKARKIHLGVCICAGYVQTAHRPVVLCFLRGERAHDNRGRFVVPGYPLAAPMGQQNEAEFFRDQIKEIVCWYTGYEFKEHIPLITVNDLSTDGHSLQNYLVVLPAKNRE